jgi:hypothetical protein
MAERKLCIKYIDDRPIFIPKLTFYPGGKSFPGGDNILQVTEGERKNFLRLKNGINPCWEDMKESRKRGEDKIESEV